MDRFRLSHILRCGLIAPILVTSFATTQDRDAAAQVLSASYQKWLDEDVGYLISDEERAEYKGLKTDQQRDMFVEDFWERRNPNPGSTENTFKEEHYRRLAYVNEQFAASVPGFKTDRGRTYIRYGAPDQIDQHFLQQVQEAPVTLLASVRSRTTGSFGTIDISRVSVRT